MASANQIKIVLSEELLQLRSAEDVAAATLILFPIGDVLVWVVPEQVCHESFVWDVRWLRDLLDLLEAIHVHADATVHAHDFLVDQSH